MLMAIKDEQVLIKQADSTQYAAIKSWGLMRWVNADQMLKGPVSRDLLNRLAGLVVLPPSIEGRRRAMNWVAEAIDRERMNPEPKPIIPPPVKVKPYLHQIRGYNMALLALGLAEPAGKEENDADRS